MKIEFSSGEAGFHEARVLHQLCLKASEFDPQDTSAIQALDQYKQAATQALDAPEYATFNQLYEPRAVSPVVLPWWRRWLGPSRLEQRLATERANALERAARAEQSAFDSLAETARVARERDELKAQIAAFKVDGGTAETTQNKDSE